MVSVIVPIYNIAELLPRCIESIINQSYSDLEIILVNDGSTDDSLIVCNNYLVDSRVKIIDKRNGGVSSARNAGLKNSNGEYIVFVDSDDELEKRSVEIMINEIKDYDLVISGLTKINNQKEKVEYIPKEQVVYKNEIVNFIEKHYLEHVMSSPCSKLYKKKLCDNLFFDESISLGEDLKFNIEYFKKVNTLHVIPQSTYLYYDVSNSLTKKYKDGYFDSFLEVYNTTKGVIEDLNGCFVASMYNNINFKLVSFAISFICSHVKISKKTEAIEFIKLVCENKNVHEACLNIGNRGYIYKFFSKKIYKKRINSIYILAKMKNVMKKNLLS